MVIWYISKYASPSKYYFGTRHFYLGEEWVKKGHEVYIFTSNASHLTNNLPKFKGKSYSEKINGVNTVWLNTYRSERSSGMTRILSWLHFEWQLFTLGKRKIAKPDVVIISSLSLLTVINAYLFAKRHGAKLIFEIRDIWPLSAIELGGYSKGHPFMRLLAWIEKFGYRKAGAIVGTIPNLAEHVQNVIGTNNKCYCIPQGLSLDFYKDNEKLDDAYIDKNIPKNKFIVAYAGTINANNPLDTLIEAAKKLANHQNIHFLIIGKGDMKEKWMERTKDLSNVSFPPPVDKKKINHFLSFVDVCFDSFESTLARYGLSRNKWIDYMFAGKPIICSYSGYQSMINEANSGSFVKYGDVDGLVNEIVAYSKKDKCELEAMGARAKKYLLENRTFDKLASQYENIMNNIPPVNTKIVASETYSPQGREQAIVKKEVELEVGN